MSIPDNPFSSTEPETHRIGSSESGRVTTQSDPASGLVSPNPPFVREEERAHSDGAITPSPARTPGGSVLQHPGVARPPRPPRHVQFNNDSRVVAIEPLQPSAPGTPEQTLTAHNIDQIDTALERHRTSQRRRPPKEISLDSSRDELTDDDYDYRLDVDPPGPPPTQPLEPVGSADSATARARREGDVIHELLGGQTNEYLHGEYIPLGETDGLPTMVSEERQMQAEHDAAKELVRAHTGKWGTLRRRVRSATIAQSAFAQGESEHPRHLFHRHRQELEPHAEGAASPGQGSTGPEDPEKQDADVHRHRSLLRRHRSPENRDSQERGDRGDFALPRRQSGGLPPLPGGGGTSVLSSLLQLYNQSNLPNSNGTSLASSRASSFSEDDYSSDDSHLRKTPTDEPYFSQQTSEKPELEKIVSPDHGEEGIIRQPLETLPAEEVRPETDSGLPQQPPNTTSSSYVGSRLSGQNSGDATPSSKGWLSYFKRAKDEVVEKIDDADRPEAARSGAGVFGALLQSTANVSGVATPAASALAPAAKRAGFQLNRFSIPETDAPLVAPKRWRPPSQQSSRSNSRPPSVHSSAGVSGADSTEKGRSRSASDDTKVAISSVSPHGSSTTSPGIVAKVRPKPQGLGKLPAAAFGAPGNALRSAEKWIASKTPLTTPPTELLGDVWGRPLTEEEKRRKEWEKERRAKKKAKKARKKQEIFIIQHVAAVLARQQFLLKLARALMMFGSPSHRLETQIQATARVLELNAQVVYIPGVMLISFNDEATHTSETKFLKQSTGIDLGKVLATHNIYWNVIHDRVSVDQASKELDVLMTTSVYYTWWQTLIIGALCSAFITVIGYHGSFIDALMTMPLGAALVAVQMLAAKNDMFSNVFEIAIATLISFISAALASTRVFCYTALVSGGVVLILPGYIVLCGALELASRNIVAGSVRVGYSVIYSLFLGFGISIGAELYHKITGLEIVGFSTANFSCHDTHSNAPWYQITPSEYWYFLCCPAFPIMLALKNQQPLFAKELPIMTFIAVCGWLSNHFSASAFPNRSDMTSAIGAFVVGTLGNIYGRFSHGASFPVTVVGILYQLPSGLANGGIFNFAQESTSGNAQAYSDGFSVAEQLISVAIGLTVGLFVSAVATNPLGGGRRTGSGIFAF